MNEVSNNNNIISVKQFKNLEVNKQIKYLKNFIKTVEKVVEDSFSKFAKMYSLLSDSNAKRKVINAIDSKIESLNEKSRKVWDESLKLDWFGIHSERKINSNSKLIKKLKKIKFLSQLEYYYLEESKTDKKI
jgi:hypothetical protein